MKKYSKILNTIKLMLSQELVLETATLVDGTVIEYEGELAVGTVVYVVGEDGEYALAPDGTHETDSLIIETEAGVITEITEREAEGEADEAPEVELEEDDEETADEDEEVELDELEEIRQSIQLLNDRIDNIASEFAAYVAGQTEQADDFAKIKELLEKIAELPAVPSKKIVDNKFNATGSRAARIINS